MGNLSLHLIKGVPAVHPDSNLIVGHIALVVADMAALRSRLTSLGVETRKNISVPNPSKDGKSPVDQVNEHPHEHCQESCKSGSSSPPPFLSFSLKGLSARSRWVLHRVLRLPRHGGEPDRAHVDQRAPATEPCPGQQTGGLQQAAEEEGGGPRAALVSQVSTKWSLSEDSDGPVVRRQVLIILPQLKLLDCFQYKRARMRKI